MHVILGAILARIACIFRVTEMLLVKLTGSAKGKVRTSTLDTTYTVVNVNVNE